MCKTHTTISNYFINKSHFAFPSVNHIRVFVGGGDPVCLRLPIGKGQCAFPFVPSFAKSIFPPNWSLDAPGSGISELVFRAACSVQFDVVSPACEQVWPLKKISHITKWTFVPWNFFLPPSPLICALERQSLCLSSVPCKLKTRTSACDLQAHCRPNGSGDNRTKRSPMGVPALPNSMLGFLSVLLLGYRPGRGHRAHDDTMVVC